MIALAIVGVIASIAIPYYKDSTRSTKAAACTSNRDAIRKSVLYYMDKMELQPGSPLPTLEDMKAADVLKEIPSCPSGGTYVWIDEEVMEGVTPRIGCSFHYWPSLAPPEEESDEAEPLFDSGLNSLDGLSTIKGAWDASGGSLVATGGKNGRGSNLLTMGDPTWDDFDLDMTVTPDSNKGYDLYYRGDLNAKGNAFDSGYQLTYNPSSNTLSVRPIEDGKAGKPLDRYKLPKGFPKTSQPHDIGISTNGSSHTISLNGQTIMSFNDSKHTSGVSGIASGKKGNTFSNIRVIDTGG